MRTEYVSKVLRGVRCSAFAIDRSLTNFETKLAQTARFASFGEKPYVQTVKETQLK
jgi:hypothetical protein